MLSSLTYPLKDICMNAYVDIVEDSLISAVNRLSLCMKFGLFLKQNSECVATVLLFLVILSYRGKSRISMLLITKMQVPV